MSLNKPRNSSEKFQQVATGVMGAARLRMATRKPPSGIPPLKGFADDEDFWKHRPDHYDSMLPEELKDEVRFNIANGVHLRTHNIRRSGGR